jgi:hypothetical protein
MDVAARRASTCCAVFRASGRQVSLGLIVLRMPPHMRVTVGSSEEPARPPVTVPCGPPAVLTRGIPHPREFALHSDQRQFFRRGRCIGDGAFLLNILLSAKRHLITERRAALVLGGHGRRASCFRGLGWPACPGWRDRERTRP